ncbi:MAG: hypothetical protein GWO78_06780 [Dehalococcoidales bacterium]|nr:hypothetical protein [Dehalococcoidales bacterium]
MDALTLNIIIFAISAVSTIVFGSYLAKYGDVLASITGLGRIFVGSILVALATSLPELSANISAVLLDPPNPALALGDILGSNMVNMLIFGSIALIFGGKTVIDQISSSQIYLASLSIFMTIVVLLVALINFSYSFFNVGLSSLIIIIFYIVGLRFTYTLKPDEESEDEEVEISAKKAWIYFISISVGVILSGYFLAYSVDNISHETGVASSTLGIIVSSIVTSMPEASAFFASVRLKAADLGIAGLFGSCVFNVTIIFYTDIFYVGNIVKEFENAHIIATITGLLLISLAGLAVYLKSKARRLVINSVLSSIVIVYALGIILITT